MNIAVNAVIIDEKPTGLGIYALNIVNELSKLTPLYAVTSYSSPFESNSNINIIRAPEIIQPKYKKPGAAARFLWLNIFLPGILKKHKIDLLINLTHHGLFFSKIRQVLTVHDLIPLRFASQYRLQNYYYRFLMPFLIRRSEKINTCSESTKKDILKYFNIAPGKIAVTGNGFNPFQSSSPYQGESNYILMIGATFRHKNCHSVLEAYGRSEMLQEYTLVIGGGQRKYLKYLKSLSKRLNIQDRINFKEYVDPRDLPALYSQARVFVYPSFYEGFGMPPLEAMQMGIPVVASGTGAIMEVCGDAAVYCNPYSVDDIKEKMEMAVLDKGLRSDLIREGFKTIEKHNWQYVAERIYDFIKTGETGNKQKCGIVPEAKTIS